MRILLANKFFFLNGGSERVFFQERDYLIGSGHQVIDFSMQDERNFPSAYSSYFVPKIDYYKKAGLAGKVKNGLYFIHSPVAVANIRQLIEHEQPELAHLHNIYHQLTPSIIPVLKEHGVKVVLTLHDFKLICPSYIALDRGRICTACGGSDFFQPIRRNCRESWYHSVLLSLESSWHKWRKSYEQVDLFIVPSRFLGDMVAQRVPRHKVAVIHNGVDTDAFDQHFAYGDGYALYFGRLSREKGVETLLQAHAKVSEKVPLKIVGTGPLREELENKYPAAEFLEYKTGDELKKLIYHASFVVVPSEWYENCSMVVLEAMAAGKPVIGSRVGGIPEQVDDGRTGFLVPMEQVDVLAEKMLELINNPDLCTSMGKAGREKVEQEYSLERHCRQLIAAYNGIE